MRLLLLAATALLAAFALACNDAGGGETLTLEQYFAEMERISNEAGDAIDELESPDLSEDAAFEDARDYFADFLGTVAGATEDAIDDMRGLDPPDEVQDEHDRFVDALDELPAISRDLEDQVAGAETQEEFDEIVSASDPFESVGGEITVACQDLQQIAEDNSIEVDLECGDEA